ncbi:MAG: glucan endo-1,6-beta-glucosidase [Prevotellaceae bacterium]|jgi:glucosylceramidase|nr:glucan endo-1,6-beta-glucosidase [Prevotellaceae bacterium]
MLNKKTLIKALLAGGLTCCLLQCSDPSPSPGFTPEPAPDDETGIVEVYLTTGDQQNLLKRLTPIKLGGKLAGFTISLDSTVLHQEMDGFGAALTGSSAYLLKNMLDAKRAEILQKIFDPSNGIGMSYLRLTIGSSDFSLGNYSYCDLADITRFGIPDIDQRDLLPVLKEILAINPDLKILASPWSAPAWMKQNNHMNGGSLIATPEIYAAFADYFVKYVEAFEQEGIRIDAITLQNEPLHETGGYPTMKMEWQEQSEIIKNYLGPRFVANNITTKIIIYDHNWDMWSYPNNILKDPETQVFVDGSGFHGYGGTYPAMGTLHNLHPDKALYFTEQSAGGWGDGFAGDLKWHAENIFTGPINNWSKNVLMWNLALNPQSGPTNGGCTNCRGVATISGNAYSFNEEYYIIGHFSKFVHKGACRITHSLTGSCSNFFCSAFINANGSKVLFAANNSNVAQNFNVRCGNREFNYIIPAISVVTFTWK